MLSLLSACRLRYATLPLRSAALRRIKASAQILAREASAYSSSGCGSSGAISSGVHLHHSRPTHCVVRRDTTSPNTALMSTSGHITGQQFHTGGFRAAKTLREVSHRWAICYSPNVAWSNIICILCSASPDMGWAETRLPGDAARRESSRALLRALPSPRSQPAQLPPLACG